MKKFILPIVVAVTATLSSSSYAEFAWYASTKTRLQTKLTDADKHYVGGELQITKIRYSENLKNRLEENLPNATVSNHNGYLRVDDKTELAYGYGGQCVSFVKANTNASTKQTKDWKPYKRVGIDSIRDGRAIAVFDSNGKYAYHTGIYLRSDSDGIWILDQNWSSNIVTIHKIKFGKKPTEEQIRDKKGDGDRFNAYSYFTIE